MADVPKKDIKCRWRDSEQKSLLVICREYHKKNGIDTHFNWDEIAEFFLDKTRKVVKPKECKNKFDYMRSVWRAWVDLRYKETGCGWNESSRTIEASDEWWEKKIKENDKYRRFRRKPVDLDLVELWNSVYNSICATGQHCVSSNMDHTHSTLFDVGVGDIDDIDAYLLDEQDVDLEGFIEPIVPPMSQQTSVGVSHHSLATLKRSKVPSTSQQLPKPKKKRPSMPRDVVAHMAYIEEKSEKFLSYLQGDMVSTGNTGHRRTYDVDDAIAVISRFVAEGVIENVSPLWCYVVDEINNYHSRCLFMTLQSDQEKMAWLEYKFKKQS